MNWSILLRSINFFDILWKKGDFEGIFAPPLGVPLRVYEKYFLKNDSTHWYGSNVVLTSSIGAFFWCVMNFFDGPTDKVSYRTFDGPMDRESYRAAEHS